MMQVATPMDSLGNVNQSISATSLHEQNNKAINAVFLATWAKGIHEFTVEQREVLESIIWQCPLLAGPAIFLARAMYAEIENTVYLDEESCWQQGIQLRQQLAASKDGLKVYPNPTDGLLGVSILDKQFIALSISVYNSMGIKAMALTCSPTSTSWVFSLAGLPSGIYTVVVTGNDGQTKCCKVVFSK